MFKKSLIILGGDVGSGKTTCARYLIKLFLKKDLKVKYTQIKSFHLFSKALLLLTLILYRRSLLLYTKKISVIRLLIIINPSLLKKIFGIVSFFNIVDILLTLIIRQYFFRILYEILVIEDHVLGYINDFIFFMFFLNIKKKDKITVLWNIGFRVFLKAAQNSCMIFLYTNYTELIKRYITRRSVREYAEYIAAGRIGLNLIRYTGLKILYIDTSYELGFTTNILKNIVIHKCLLHD